MTLNFSVSSVFFHEFSEFCEIHEFGEIHQILELWEIHKFRDGCSGTGCTISHQAVTKTVFCMACFAYLLLLLLLLLLFLSLLCY